MDVLIQGNVPIGAGLSSSAALEVAAAETCRVLGNIDIGKVDLALLSQSAERKFVGVQCGIMDQFISTLARENTAMFLDCRDLAYSLVPLRTDARIVVCDSRVQRRLDSSEYNKRRTECEEAVRLLAGKLGPVQALRDIQPDQLTENESVLPELLLKRARHVVTENDRVLKCVEALKRGDVHQFGELLYQSHQSLREDYEVSCRELDLLVRLAARQPGTLGARMTGAGFGGCTVNLVEARAVNDFCQGMEQGYLEENGVRPFLYVCKPSNGVSSCRLDD